MKKIAILGSTGSIGTQTLEIVRNNPDLQVVALAAGSNVGRMEEQIREFHPLVVCMWAEKAPTCAPEFLTWTSGFSQVWRGCWKLLFFPKARYW